MPCKNCLTEVDKKHSGKIGDLHSIVVIQICCKLKVLSAKYFF